VVEELRLHGTTIAEDVLSVCETVKKLELPWTELKVVTIEKAPGMTGKKSGLVCGIRGKMDKRSPEFYI
jgi:hypothetical protein